MRSKLVSRYNLRQRSINLKSKWTEEKEISDAEFETNELMQQLFIQNSGKIIKLSEQMREQFARHDYKKHLIACSIPVPNEAKTEMKDNTDAIVFANEVFDLSKQLLTQLSKMVSKEVYFMDYLDYVQIQTQNYVNDVCFCVLVYFLFFLVLCVKVLLFCFLLYFLFFDCKPFCLFFCYFRYLGRILKMKLQD